jgi:peroxiredoxin
MADVLEDICMLDAPLSVRLASYADKVRQLSFPFAEAYDDLAARLLSGEIGKDAPAVGETMPDFVLPERTGHLVSLDDILARGPAVISFNRGHWCPFCKIELRSLAENYDEITALGASVVSIIPDRQEFASLLRTWTSDKIIILSDVDNGYTLSMGLALWLGDRLKDLMTGRGVNLDLVQGNSGWFVPLPATFVLAPDKRVVARFIDPDIRRRMETSEILDALRAIAR